MAVYRINKTDNYTVLSNTHLKDRTLSLKAKGLLTMMLSLPDDWKYSINGLVSICKESETAIKNTVNELKKCGYISVTKEQDQFGRFIYIYDVFENPHMDNPDMENPGVENPPMDNPHMDNPDVENHPLYKVLNKSNTKELNTKEPNIKELSTEDKKDSGKPNTRTRRNPKNKYGEYQNVLLTEEELERLYTDKGKETTDKAIKFLDEYIEEKGYKSKSHNLAIRRWVLDAIMEKEVRNIKQVKQAPKKTQFDEWMEA